MFGIRLRIPLRELYGFWGIWFQAPLRGLYGCFYKQLDQHFVMGESSHAPRNRNITYVQIFRRYIDDIRHPEHLHLPIRRNTNDAPRDPLCGPVTRNPAPLWIYSLKLRLLLHHQHPVDAAIGMSMLPHIDTAHCPHQLSNKSNAIGIVTFSLVIVYDLIWLIVHEFFHLTIFDLIWLIFFIWFHSH